MEAIFGGHPIPDWIMDVSFWAAVGAIIVAGVISVFLAGFCLHMLAFAPGRKKLADPESAQVPDGAYRVHELRDFLDPLWMKLFGRAIDDFQLTRIDRAMGRATVGEYKQVVIAAAVPKRGLPETYMFLALARRAAIDAELSKSGTLNPRDVFELEKISAKEPVNRS